MRACSRKKNEVLIYHVGSSEVLEGEVVGVSHYVGTARFRTIARSMRKLTLVRRKTVERLIIEAVPAAAPLRFSRRLFPESPARK